MMKLTYLILGILLMVPFSLGANVMLVSDNEADYAVAQAAAEETGDAIVTTRWGLIDDGILDKITSYEPNKVTIIGGPDAVPELIEAELDGVEIVHERIYGEDRYETSVVVAEEVWDSVDEVVAATGDDIDGIEDALADAKAAKRPVIILRPDGVPERIRERLRAMALNKIRFKASPDTVDDEIGVDLDEIVAGNVTIDRPDFSERAQLAIDRAAEKLDEAKAVETPENISDARAALISKQVILAEGKLATAQLAFDEEEYGLAFGQAVASRAHSVFAIKVAERADRGKYGEELNTTADKFRIRKEEVIRDLERAREAVRAKNKAGLLKDLEQLRETERLAEMRRLEARLERYASENIDANRERIAERVAKISTLEKRNELKIAEKEFKAKVSSIKPADVLAERNRILNRTRRMDKNQPI
ncbi:MAG: cell wall-binding repeat-containing protein [archaeon]